MPERRPPAPRPARRRGPRPLLAISLGVLVLGALAFAIIASRDASDGSGSRAAGSEGTGSSVTAAGGGGFDGAELPGDRPAPAIDLTDQYGHEISLAGFRGEPVIVTFLYTGCGAQCVLIAQQIRGALNELARPVPVLVVSAEPAADRPAAVHRFLAQVSLSGRVHYLSGTTAQLQPIWRAYRITPASRGRAAFEASALVLLVDRAGDERVLYSIEQLTPEVISHDVGKLQSG